MEYPEPKVIVQSVEVCFPIYTFDLSKALDLEQTCRKIYKLRNSNPKTTTTNVVTNKGWRSPYYGQQDPEAQQFAQEIHCIQQALKKINSFDTELANLWAVIYSELDQAKEHNHFTLWNQMAYNTVLYLTDTQTPIVFEHSQGTLELRPRLGELVVMHPLVMHSVPEVMEDERMILAANFGRR